MKLPETISSSAERRHRLIQILQLSDLSVVALSLLATLSLVSHETTVGGWLAFLEIRLSLGNMLFAVVYVLAWNPLMHLRGLYESHRLAPGTREISSIGSAVVIAVLPLVPLRHLLGLDVLTLEAIEIFGALSFLALCAERRLFRRIARALRLHGRNLRDVIIVGEGPAALQTTGLLARTEGLGYNVIEVIDAAPADAADAAPKTITERVSRVLESRPIDEVFVSVSLERSQALLERLATLCEEEGVTMRVVSRLAVLQWAWASIDSIQGQPIITISPTRRHHGVGMAVKRTLDVVISGFALLILAPLMGAIAIAIKLDSKGPALFSQERVGLNRRSFKALKFRTMVDGADAMQARFEDINEAQGPVFKIERDPRVTRLGRFLRRSSLDELPQLINVLRGEMSLVGPRPLPVRDVDRIDTRWHRRRFSVKPGVTCLWQVTSREPRFDEWIRMDMEYIDSWSLTLDAKILLRTIPAVLSGHGAY